MGVINLNNELEELKEKTEALGTVVTSEKTLVLASSTESSTKRFTITVNDSGEVTATEIV